MGQQHRATAFCHDILQRWHDPVNPSCVGDLAIFNRDIDIDTGEDEFAAKVHVVERVEGHLRLHRLAGAVLPRASVRQKGFMPPAGVFLAG